MSGGDRWGSALRSGAWLWAAVALAVLGAGGTAAIHARQRSVLGRAFHTLDAFRGARVDLAEGFLHASLGGEEGPFDRAQGLALLEQATAVLQRAGAELDDQGPGTHAEALQRFELRVQSLREALGAWRAMGGRDPAQETALRITHQQLEQEAEAFDAALAARLGALSAELDRQFRLALAVSAALVACVCAAALVAARRRRAMVRGLQLAEARLRVLLDHVPDWVWLKDLDSRFVAVSAALARRLGRTREELQGLSDREIWGEELAATYQAGDRQALEAGAPVRFEEQAGVGADEVWLETVKAPVLDAGGRPQGTVGVARDVTERHRAAGERAALEARLAQGQRLESVGRLAGGVAHDFNNMLGVILGAADVIQAGLPPESELADAVLDLKEAALRSRGITRQLLTISRQQPIRPQAVDVDAALEAGRGTVVRLLGEDLELRLRLGAGGWAVRIDPSQLDQLLMNLVVNAREATAGAGVVELETDRVLLDGGPLQQQLGAQPGPHVRLCVRDHGAGMGADTLAHLFEPFFTTKAQRGGTGLGLATVYGIVAQAQGGVSVASQPGEGTTFEIYLPRCVEVAPAREAARPAVPEQARRVLLVEDDATVRTMTTRMLEQLGHQVETAASADEAIRIYEQGGEGFDLLLTDVVMPGMGGPELRRQLAARHPGLRVLFVSGWSPEVAARRGGLEPGVHLLQKPFTLEELSRAMREAMA